ncbi:hypothetical protein Rs2_45755 [Raphanus sativus]|nr:hypothetical protein Rs2_45755 [Raphanus sativus]
MANDMENQLGYITVFLLIVLAMVLFSVSYRRKLESSYVLLSSTRASLLLLFQTPKLPFVSFLPTFSSSSSSSVLSRGETAPPSSTFSKGVYKVSGVGVVEIRSCGFSTRSSQINDAWKLRRRECQEPPFNEDMPRLQIENFHYTLEDVLSKEIKSKESVTRFSREQECVGSNADVFKWKHLGKILAEQFGIEEYGFKQGKNVGLVDMMKGKERVKLSCRRRSLMRLGLQQLFDLLD